MTLIEIIIAIAILGIIAAAFLTAFSSGYSMIFTMGHKTQATGTAQEIMDAIYLEGDPTPAKIETLLASKGYTYESKSTYSNLVNDAYNNKDVRYCIETTNVLGTNSDTVSVLVFYQGGKQSVTLTSVIP